MKRITLLADINGYSGYGLHAIQLARDVERLADCYVSIRPTSTSEAFGSVIPTDIRQRFVQGVQPEPWEILLHPPDFAPTPGKRTLYFSMHETSRLPAKAVKVLNMADVVVVPCRWNEQCFLQSGVTSPIRVVRLGLDDRVFYRRPFPGTCRTIFGAAGRMAHGGVRKGINEVINAFLYAFHPSNTKVELWVKCYPDCPVQQVSDPRIKITAAHLTDRELADWFAGITCFVSAARGEGFGLMQLQAMATGRPLISVSYGGVAEFFNSELQGWPLDYDLAPAKFAYEGQGDWAEAKEWSLTMSMQQAAKNQLEQVMRGIGASKAVEGLTWENSHRQLIAVLQEFGAL